MPHTVDMKMGVGQAGGAQVPPSRHMARSPHTTQQDTHAPGKLLILPAANQHCSCIHQHADITKMVNYFSKQAPKEWHWTKGIRTQTSHDKAHAAHRSPAASHAPPATHHPLQGTHQGQELRGLRQRCGSALKVAYVDASLPGLQATQASTCCQVARGQLSRTRSLPWAEMNSEVSPTVTRARPRPHSPCKDISKPLRCSELSDSLPPTEEGLQVYPPAEVALQPYQLPVQGPQPQITPASPTHRAPACGASGRLWSFP